MEANAQTVKTILKYTFGIVPMVAGVDKFTNVLADWADYLPEGLVGMLPFESTTIMLMVGVIEILAGILVFTKTRIGAYVVSAWLAAIAITLLFTWSYVDVAIRDLVMAIAALSLAKLSDDNSVALTR